jgi:hypothetical protein
MSTKAGNEAALRQEWSTPRDFRNAVRAEFCPTLDVCATALNRFSLMGLFIGPPDGTEEELRGAVGVDGLSYRWSQFRDVTCWCNPGYSDVMPWMKKAVEECHDGAEVLLLTHASHAEWAQYGWLFASECRLLYPRVQFDPAPGVKRSSNARDGFLWVFRRNQRPNKCLITPWVWKEAQH